MALSGSVSTSKYDGRYYTLSWTATQDVNKNTSKISWTLKAVGGNSNWYAERDLKVTIAGKTVFSKTSRVERYKGTIDTGSLTISHDSTSGNASFTVKVQAAVYGTSINCTGSKTFTLDTIQRATVPTFSVDRVELGDSVTASFIRFESDGNSGFTHTLEVQFGEITEVIGTGIEENEAVTWVAPISYARQIPNSTSDIMIFTCHTYNGDTLIGSCSVNKIAYIPERIVPTVFIEHEEVNTNIAGIFGAYLKGESRLKIESTGYGAFDSTITSYKVVVDGVTYSGESVETELLKTSGTIPITVSVTDSRGRTGTTTEEIVVHDYSTPIISLLEAERCKSATDGSEDLEGEHVNVHLVANVTELAGNSLRYTVFYKKASETEEVSKTFTPSGYAVNSETIVGIIETESAYNFRVVVTDAIGNKSESTVNVGTAAPPVDYHSSGKGISFGKIAEEEGVADFAMTIKPREGFDFLSIPENTDFNDLKTPNVFVGNNAAEAGFPNCPVSEGAFTLEIIGSDDGILQRVSVLSKVDTETVQRVFSEGSWGEWINKGSGSNGAMIKMHRTLATTGLSTSYNYFNPFTGSPAVDFEKGNLSHVSQTVATYGDRTDFEVNGILIGKGINQVRVVANICYENQDSSTTILETSIHKLSNGVSTPEACTGSRILDTERVTQLVSTIIDVVEGDFIYLMGYKGLKTRDIDILAKANGIENISQLCVEAIG